MRFGRTRARGRTTRREPGKMNKLEAAYAEVLQARKLAGEIVDWAFEPEKLRLADMTWYSPDFRVLHLDGQLEFVETKACRKNGVPLYEDDARVKIKVAAETHWMYRFVGAYRLPKGMGGGWKMEEF
jgi:3'-phosphoadenosine 5'-phosphosulfate sulfotransferase (PAPS reductase)/FAD synthetase